MSAEVSLDRVRRSRSAFWWAWLALGAVLLVLGLHVGLLVLRGIGAPPAICPDGSFRTPPSWISAIGAPNELYLMNIDNLNQAALDGQNLIYALEENENGVFFLSHRLPLNESEMPRLGEGPRCRYFTIESQALLAYEPLPSLVTARRRDDEAMARLAARAAAAARFREAAQISEVEKSIQPHQVREWRRPNPPEAASIRLFEVAPSDQFPEHGLVCVANWGVGDSQLSKKLDDAVSYGLMIEGSGFFVNRTVYNEILAARVCFGFLRYGIATGWTLLPSFLSTNWRLRPTDDFLHNVIWFTDRLALEIAKQIRPMVDKLRMGAAS